MTTRNFGRPKAGVRRPRRSLTVVTAFLDANILYPSGLRSFLMFLGLTGAFRPRWSARVHQEWIAALLQQRPDLSHRKLLRNQELVDRHAPEAMVAGYEHLIAGLRLPGPADRHVLAAAIHSGASAIVTLNLKDFPPEASGEYGIEVLHPDEFVQGLFLPFSELVIDAARDHRCTLKKPPMSREQYTGMLEAQGLPKTASLLRQFPL